MDTERRLEELLIGYSINTISESEYDEFFVMLSKGEYESWIKETLEKELFATEFSFLTEVKLQTIWNKIVAEPICSNQNKGK